MKKLFFVVIAAAALFLVSCGGGKAVKTVPRHLSEGGKQVKKGLHWYHKGCYQKSLEYFFSAYELYSASDIQDGVAMSLNNIGTIYRILGNCEQAVSFFQEAYTIFSDLNDREGAVRALSNKAAAFICMGKLDNAEDVIEEALLSASQENNRHLLIPLLQKKGVLLTKRGLYQAAEKTLTASLSKADGSDCSQMASLHFAFGNLMLEASRPADAVASFEKALSFDRKIGFYKGMADDLLSMGLAHMRLGQDEKAVGTWKRSAKIFALIDQPKQVHETMKHLKQAAQEAGIDISVTEAFIERWRQGRLYENPCEQ